MFKALDRQLAQFVLKRAFGELLDVSVEQIEAQLTSGLVIIRDARFNVEVCKYSYFCEPIPAERE